MARTSKRSTDLRRIQATETYSVKEVALLFDKSESTVMEWTRRGLPTIDDREPMLFYGWALKAWHRAWWQAKKFPCGPTEFYCNPCKAKRQPEAGSISIQRTAFNSFRALARCSICGATMFRGIKAEHIAEIVAQKPFQEMTGRFIDSRTLPSNAEKNCSDADFENSAGSKVEGYGAIQAHAAPKMEPNWPRNADNERMKREYYDHLRHAGGLSTLSIQKQSIAIIRYESQNNWQHLADFTAEKARLHKDFLQHCNLKVPTRVAELRSLRRFFTWMTKNQNLGVKFGQLDIDFLQPSLADRNAAQSVNAISYPSLADALIAFHAMPNRTLIDKRNRGLFGLLASTGVRIGAVRTLRIRHYKPDKRMIHQDPTQVATKFRKEIFTYLLDVDDEFVQAFHEWYAIARDQLQFLPDDPLFPKVGQGNTTVPAFAHQELTRQPYDAVIMLEKIIKGAFQAVGLPAFPPHRFRNMLVREMFDRGLSPAQFKAWSQNLGHATPKTSIMSYGRLSVEEQGAIIAKGSRDASGQAATVADFKQLTEKVEVLIQRTLASERE